MLTSPSCGACAAGEANAVTVPDDLPLEVAAAFACGVNTGAGGVLNVLKPGRAFDFTLEAAGRPQALRDAVDSLTPLGVCCLVGSARKGTEARLEMTQLQHGRTLRGRVQGDAPAALFFPALFDLWRRASLPVEKLIRFYDFADVNRAIADKPVLRIS